jgi:hypothetical protein
MMVFSNARRPAPPLPCFVDVERSAPPSTPRQRKWGELHGLNKFSPKGMTKWQRNDPT